MRHIDIDTDVFAAIWSLRNPGERSENEVLRRLLGVERELHRDSPDRTEVKTSKHEAYAQKEITEMGKIRWVDDVRAVLLQFGGKGQLENIYRAVEERRRAAGRSIPRTLDAVIRRTLEDHSSDSANFRGDDLFRLISRGEWALR